MSTARMLTADETALWHAWKRATEAVRSRIVQEIGEATGLSEPDFGVLTRVDDAGGRLRQNELATSMLWHRSRLSHHLTRMVDRDLVSRATVDGGVEVRLTAAGRAATQAARPVHAEAVRRHLLEAIPPADRDGVLAVLVALVSD